MTTQVFIRDGVPMVAESTFECDNCHRWCALNACTDHEWNKLSPKAAGVEAMRQNMGFTFMDLADGGGECSGCGYDLCIECFNANNCRRCREQLP